MRLLRGFGKLHQAGCNGPGPDAQPDSPVSPVNVLLVYGTSEGQTRKIARFVSSRLLQSGQKVLTADARESAFIPEPRGFDAVVLAASLHAGHYQRPIIDFVKRNRSAISGKTNAFLSVSLTAAGSAPRDAADLARCVADFVRETGWTPERIHHVAGALRYSTYGLFTRWAMKRIAARRGGPTDTRRDHELTDWDDLAKFIDAFIGTPSATVGAHAQACRSRAPLSGP